MKKRILTYTLLLLTSLLWAEQRVYLIRGGALPEDEAVCTDLRPEHSTTTWALRNIYRSATARYALFEKRADSWWQVSVETNRPVDFSSLSSNATLCIRLRSTVNYPLTLCLFGQTTDEGYRLPQNILPADGQWHTVKVDGSHFSLPDAPYSGSLVRLHSDLGYTGNEVGIDFCYLTDDASQVDEGQVLPEERYYLVSNRNTPKQEDVSYTLTNMQAALQSRYSAWQQWSYIPFPYLSMEQASAVSLQLCGNVSLPLVDEDWALIAQMRTNMLGTLVLTCYLPSGRAYTDTIQADELVRDNRTWNRLYLPLDDADLAGDYAQPSDVRISLTSPSLTAGELAIGSLVLSNNHQIMDPDPFVPGDPANGQQIWLVGESLPENTTVTDYRLFETSALTVSYGNNTQRKATDAFLTLLPTNGWYSADVSAAPGQVVDLTPVKADWTLHTRIRTTSAYRPINIILYALGNQQLYRYSLTDQLLPVAENGAWKEFDIPMSTFLGAYPSLFSYASSRIFSFHSDNGGTAGVEVSMQYLYFAKEGEATPAPVPGEAPLPLPVITPDKNTFLSENEAAETPAKIFVGGQIYIMRGNKVWDTLGRVVK